MPKRCGYLMSIQLRGLGKAFFDRFGKVTSSRSCKTSGAKLSDAMVNALSISTCYLFQEMWNVVLM